MTTISEKSFTGSLIKTIRKFDSAVVIRPNDQRTVGIPDLLAYIPLGWMMQGQKIAWSVAIEAKTLQPLMDDPYHKGRRTGKMLKHPFTGTQVSMLRYMAAAGVDAFGLVRVSVDTAFRYHPDDISAKTGNFTHEEMVEFGVEVRREKGIWNFWRGNHGQILGPRHRDGPRD